MRALKSTSVFVAIFVLFVSAPAHAWFGWLDNLSGPGTFKGPQWGFRLICFGEESDEKRLVDGMKKANALTERIRFVVADEVLSVNKAIDEFNAAKTLPDALKDQDKQKQAEDAFLRAKSESEARVDQALSAAADAWRGTMIGIQSTLLTFQMLDRTASDAYFDSIRVQVIQLQKVRLPDRRPKAPNPLIPINDTDRTGLIKQVIDALDAMNGAFAVAIAPIDRGTSAVNGSGVFLSVCSNDSMRRASLDLMTDFWHAGGESAYADNHRIVLTMVIPEFSVRLFADPRWDFVDVGVGAGVYWFTSAGFESFSGLVLEPIFFNLRIPSRWNAPNLDKNVGHWVQRLLAGVTFRAGITTFPSGFAPNAFGGGGPANVRIPAEGVFSMSVFYNIAPFVRRPPQVKWVAENK